AGDEDDDGIEIIVVSVAPDPRGIRGIGIRRRGEHQNEGHQEQGNHATRANHTTSLPPWRAGSSVSRGNEDAFTLPWVPAGRRFRGGIDNPRPSALSSSGIPRPLGLR